MKKVCVFATMLICAGAASVYASGGSAMPWEGPLEQVMESLSGNTARIIGVILIVAGGIAVAVTEGQAVKKLLWVIVGIGVALNAASFLSMFFSTSGGALL